MLLFITVQSNAEGYLIPMQEQTSTDGYKESKEAVISVTDKLLLEASFTAGMKNKGMSPMSLNFNIGYNFTPSLYAFAKAEGVIGLYDKEGIKTYTKGTDLGGGLGVKLLNPKKTNERLDLRVSIVNSIGNANWKHTTYQAEFILYCNSKKTRTVPYIGIGFKHMNSHTAGIDNWNGIFATIGWKF